MNKIEVFELIAQEGDKKGFMANGYTCLIMRMPLGHLCGYVLLTENDVNCGKDYDAIQLVDGVHGGLTFSEYCDGKYLPKGYWIGFDCAHCSDLIPKASYELSNQVYRTMEYVKLELQSLTKQLKEVSK